MSAAFEQLLTATVEHLKGLKENGRKFVCIAPGTLAGLQESQQTAPVSSSKQTAPIPPSNVRNASLASSFHSLKSSLGQPVPAPKPVAVHSPAPLTSTPNGEGIEELRKGVLACAKCPHLVAARKNVVFGVGNSHAKLMFVGEAPGADEDVQGEPFVGKAGQLLTKIITTMGLSRREVYIANILKCRPDTPGQAYGNRKPTLEEMKTCIPWLEKQIELIQPQVMVALGATAVEGLLGHCSGITRMRGTWQTYRNIPLMPTFHPSYLLRDERGQDKRKVWEDMLQVMEKLGMAISDKQRAYFTKSA